MLEASEIEAMAEAFGLEGRGVKVGTREAALASGATLGARVLALDSRGVALKANWEPCLTFCCAE